MINERRNPVQFTQESAQRIARVVRDAETQAPPASPLTYSPVFAAKGGGGIVLGKTGPTWPKNTLADIVVYGDGTPPNEIPTQPPQILRRCVNKFSNVGAEKMVALAKARNGSWYLIAAEC